MKGYPVQPPTDPPGASDSCLVIQTAIDWLSTNYGGGKLWLRVQVLSRSALLVFRGGVELLGHNRETTAIVADGDIGAPEFRCKLQIRG
jgi:hypothetical protein